MPPVRKRRYARRKYARKRKYKSRKKTKNYSKAYGALARPTPISKSLAVPRSKKINLRYCSQIPLNPGVAGALSAYTFSANGINDPDITGTGHQPLGHDQWTPFYNHFCVIGSKISVTFLNNDTSANQIVGISISPSPSLGTPDVTTVMESADVVYDCITHRGGGNSEHTLSSRVAPLKWLKKTFNDDKTQGVMQNTSGGNPAEQVYYVVWCSSANQTDSGGIDCVVTIDYTVILTEPKNLVQS